MQLIFGYSFAFPATADGGVASQRQNLSFVLVQGGMISLSKNLMINYILLNKVSLDLKDAQDGQKT